MGQALRYFEEIEVGEVLVTPGRTVTEADLLRFAGISGDHDALDRPQEPEPPPVPEMLTVAVTSGLGFRLPVAQPLVLAFMVFDWRFLAPVRLGDTLHCRLQVTAKRPLKEGGVLVEKREIVNQHGQVVQEGEYKLLVARRPRD
jgi:acyl dehydratase